MNSTDLPPSGRDVETLGTPELPVAFGRFCDAYKGAFGTGGDICIYIYIYNGYVPPMMLGRLDRQVARSTYGWILADR